MSAKYKATSDLSSPVKKLTVIIPFLNEGEEVENTLSSIRHTVGYTVDILIINDASTDEPDYRAIADKYGALYLYHKKRKGVAASRDQGIALMQTPYFLLLDAHMRFYQTNWADRIVEELEKDKRVLLCCDTKALRKDEKGKVRDAAYTPAFGAVINLRGNSWILNPKWVMQEKKIGEVVEDIACVLGAGYAGSREYWQYLRGLEGLVYYGSDEAYISLKVWLEGGRCRLLKDIQIGHIYRDQAPYPIENVDNMFNKLWIAELLLPFAYKIRVYGALNEINPQDYREAFRRLTKKRKKIEELKQYYDKIFTVGFEKMVQLNQIKLEENFESKKTEKLKEWFRKVLLHCNTVPTDGLWYGRMGCVLFLAQYDQEKNNNLYEELIGELIDEIYSNVEKNNLNIDFGEGLCGIAFGIAWLLHHRLMEGDINEILEEVDERIMERDPLRMTDYTLKTGLTGILYYVLYRLQIAQENHQSVPFDRDYLYRLYKAALEVVKDPEKAAAYEMASWFIAYTRDKEIKLEIPDLVQLLNLSLLQESVVTSFPWKLKEGYAGLGLGRLAK